MVKRTFAWVDQFQQLRLRYEKRADSLREVSGLPERSSARFGSTEEANPALA